MTLRGWLGRGFTALRIAADRSDLWPAGALAWLVCAGWLPLLLVVTPPDPEAIEAFGISMYLSQFFPLNVFALAGGLVAAFTALCAVAAGAEVAIHLLAVRGGRGAASWRATLTAFAIVLVGSVPVVAALGLVAAGVISVAPGEYLSSDLDTPILLRIAVRLVPQLTVALVALLVMQTLAGVALRSSFANPGRSATFAYREALRAISARRLAPLGVAAVGLLLDVLLVVLSVALLTVLWAPIGAALGEGLRNRPETILLLLGFVAIWLGLLLAAGALHVAVSAWWAMEVCTGARLSDGAPGLPAPGRAGPWAGSDTGGPR